MNAHPFYSLPEKALPLFQAHCAPLKTRSDRRALWMVCVGVTACDIDNGRITGALRLIEKRMTEQPSLVPLFQDWRELLTTHANLDSVLEATPHNQQLRSACPLAASIRPKEHREALCFFQKNLVQV